MAKIEFSSISKNYGKTAALREFNLSVKHGELVSLVGPSGCGKTTALRIAAGFVIPDDGSVIIDGADATMQSAQKRNMGMVFQNYSLFPNLTVFGNVEFGLRTRKVRSVERRKLVGETIEMVRLNGLEDRYPHQLSGGQQQRVALARALAFRPTMLLLDEPLSALDAKVRLEVRSEIRRLQSELGVTTIFVTHDQEEALSISDRLAVMSDGVVEQVGTPIDIYRHPVNSFVAQFVGTIIELEATVLSASLVDIAGQVVQLPQSEYRVGRKLKLSVRPEEFEICATSVYSGCMKGKVTRREFRGASSILEVRVAGLESALQVLVAQNEEIPNKDENVFVRIRPDFKRITPV